MIFVDIYVPSVDQEYDFGLDETSKVSSIIEEIVSMINQKEQCELKGNLNGLLLCSVQDMAILPKDKSLKECRISNGRRLLLI